MLTMNGDDNVFLIVKLNLSEINKSKSKKAV